MSGTFVAPPLMGRLPPVQPLANRDFVSFNTSRGNPKPNGSATVDLPLTFSLFDTAMPRGPAYGTTKHMTWADFARLCQQRREGTKDGACFATATFRPEPDGRVRRLGANLVARTAIALDVETDKETDEVPPDFDEAVVRIEARGWAAVAYTSHSHSETAPRFRIVLPLSAEIDFKLPAVEVIAGLLDLDDVLDDGKRGASSLFYLPSAVPGQLANHRTAITEGAPIDAAWLTELAGAVLAEREAEQARLRTEALAAAARRRDERIAHDPDGSIIEKVRGRLDLTAELLNHGYLPVAGKQGVFLYPGSETRVPGVHVMHGNDGVERVYSHHSGDPLAPGNLPSWCTVRAIDVVDVKTILDFAGDRKAALRTLAKQFDIQTRRQSDRSGQRKGNGAAEPAEPEPGQNGAGQDASGTTSAPPNGDAGEAEPPPSDQPDHPNEPPPDDAANTAGATGHDAPEPDHQSAGTDEPDHAGEQGAAPDPERELFGPPTVADIIATLAPTLA